MNTKILLVLFFCHYLADFTHLSTNWMLKAKRFGTPLFPIFCHALVHAVLMSAAIYIFTNTEPVSIARLFLIQLIGHFIIDTGKGLANTLWSPIQNPANKSHWYVFGLDQYLHAAVIILMASFL